MNELLIGNAVKFLSDNSVKNSPVEKQLSFLKNKGLNDDEIEEAFRRAGLSPPLSPSSNINNNSSYSNYNTSSNSYPNYNTSSSSYYEGAGQQDHIYQLARTSTTARWLLLFAIFASALTFIARNIPSSLYKRFVDWINKKTFINDDGKELIEIGKKIDCVKNLVESLDKRYNHIESEIISLKYNINNYHRKNEYDDCLE